jgi:hypothetical protein
MTTQEDTLTNHAWASTEIKSNDAVQATSFSAAFVYQASD